jgi:hypothetical protein
MEERVGEIYVEIQNESPQTGEEVPLQKNRVGLAVANFYKVDNTALSRTRISKTCVSHPCITAKTPALLLLFLDPFVDHVLHKE